MMTSNTPKKCTTINDLPNELIMLILENLEIRQIKKCSLVCKRFNLLCQEVKLHELIISETTGNLKAHWFFTNKQLNYQDAISMTTFNSYRSTFRLDKFRRLYFDGTATEYNQLKLNEFTLLEQVAIKLTFKDIVYQDFHINLPNLRMIEICSRLTRHKFFITTPKLEMLKYDEFDSIHLTYVDAIRHLETGFVSESNHVLNDDDIPLIKHIRDFKLTTLTCNDARDNVLGAIKKLIQDKRQHGRSSPKIYFLSVEVDDVKKIEEYENHCDVFLFQINNYNSLAETVSKETPRWSNGINYNQLMNTMKGKIPDDFFKNFSSTRRVHVEEKVENPEHLFWFLKRFDYLQALSLRSDSLDQSFYSQLGDLNQLSHLLVEDISVPFATSSKLTLNFDFLLKLKNLKVFYTNFDSPNIFDLALELFKHLKHLIDIQFYVEEKYVYINMDFLDNAYSLFYDGCIRRVLRINELAREWDAIRNRHDVQD